MKPVLNRLESMLDYFSGTLFTAVFAFTLTNIVSRNLGGVAIRWIPGMIRMSFIWSVLTATAVLYRRDDHLMVDYFLQRLAESGRRRIRIATDLITVPFFALLILYGSRMTVVRMRISYETWDFPTGYAYLALPVAAAVMLLFNLERITANGKEDNHA